MTPADCLLQNLESGPLSYTENQYNQLGRDVRDAARTCLANDHITENITSEELPQEDGPTLTIKRITWTILPAGIEQMERLRNPPEPRE